MSDGVSIVAGTWRRAFERLGWRTITVAGEGPVDRTVPGLAIDAAAPPTESELSAALADADLVVVENLLTIPLNLPAARTLAAVLAGRPAILHHHDPPWQRTRFADVTELPADDPAWLHVTINRLTEAEFRQRGFAATTVYNGIDLEIEPGDRAGTRKRFDIADDARLFVHPVRAIHRKDIPTAIRLAERFGAVYWLTGPAEEGYGPTLDKLLADATCPVVRVSLEDGRLTSADLYAAADLVLFPSIWEGFGIPPIEAAIHRRPVVVGDYPVASELTDLGFDWLDPSDFDRIADVLPTGSSGGPSGVVADPDRLAAMLDTNLAVVREHLSLEAMTRSLARLLKNLPNTAGWRV